MFVYMLKCSSCKELLQYDKFSKKSSSKRGYSYKCKDCHNKYVRDTWYKVNSDKQKESSKRWKVSNKERILASKYNTTEVKIKELFSKASDKCEVCFTEKDLCVDHCHESGRIRGVLCRKCNSVLGLMDEDKNRIKNLVKYIIDKC